MPSVWVTEYRSMGRDAQGHGIEMPLEPELRTTVLDITAGAATMAAPFLNSTALVRVHGDAAFHGKVTLPGNTAPATVASARQSAGADRYFSIAQRDAPEARFSAIAASI